jgi:hypothetical protein
MKGLAAVARPQTAGLPQAKSPAKAPVRRASQTKKAGAKKKRRAA